MSKQKFPSPLARVSSARLFVTRLKGSPPKPEAHCIPMGLGLFSLNFVAQLNAFPALRQVGLKISRLIWIVSSSGLFLWNWEDFWVNIELDLNNAICLAVLDEWFFGISVIFNYWLFKREEVMFCHWLHRFFMRANIAHTVFTQNANKCKASTDKTSPCKIYTPVPFRMFSECRITVNINEAYITGTNKYCDTRLSPYPSNERLPRHPDIRN